jgi:hypothetical protein
MRSSCACELSTLCKQGDHMFARGTWKVDHKMRHENQLCENDEDPWTHPYCPARTKSCSSLQTIEAHAQPQRVIWAQTCVARLL